MSELFNLSGKSAVITGSSRGIGKSIAIRYAEMGAKVVISSRKIDACDKVVEEIRNNGGVAYSKSCNISEKGQCNQLIDYARDKFGKIDILVCNAASNPYYGKLAEIPDELFEKIMNNNVRSNLWLCQKALPMMAKIGEGSIIIISSIFGNSRTFSKNNCLNSSRTL